MPRKRMITRTITRVNVLCMAYDPLKNAVSKIDVTIPLVKDKVFKETVSAAVEADGYNFIKILGRRIVDAKYQMAEEDFIAAATVIGQEGGGENA